MTVANDCSYTSTVQLPARAVYALCLSACFSLYIFIIFVFTGSGTGSDAGSESEGALSDDEGTTSEEEDALEGLQKRFGVTPTKREPVKVGAICNRYSIRPSVL